MDFEAIAFAMLRHSGARLSILPRGCDITYSEERIAEALAFLAEGRNFLQVSRLTGISRYTLRQWSLGHVPSRSATCAVCRQDVGNVPRGPYAYLLGLYLGDGCLSEIHRGVFKLRIACCNAYPDLMDECEMAMREVLPNRVGRILRPGCTEMYSTSKHWVCMFPQHGLGRKHERTIALVQWQEDIVDRLPAPFIRGLLHSDGCRVLNRVNNTDYPRYHFSNASDDIRGLFGRACDRLGIDWRPNNARNLSVARRASVACLDEFVGPKH